MKLLEKILRVGGFILVVVFGILAHMNSMKTPKKDKDNDWPNYF